jgi:hypothetical protein
MRNALALLLLTTPVAGQDWPPEVTAILHEATDACDGELLARPDSIFMRELNGDGTPDWVVESVGFVCSGALLTYCGTGGCVVDTVIDGKRGSLLLHSWGTVTEGGTTYLTAPNEAGRTVRFLWSGTEWVLQ